MRQLTATAPPAAAVRRWRLVPLLAACAAVAVVSLALPAALAYDAWAWVVWGREVVHLDLDTTGGPSWKPLPVAVTSVLAVFGGAAPALWLVVARTGALLLVAGTFRLAGRLAGTAAGVVAAGVLVLGPDPDPRFLRIAAEGHGAMLAAACAVWAVDRHLDGRHAQALLLGGGLALMRPESWPLLGLYALWVWRRAPATRPQATALGVAVPLLWFGGDWWGSGDPLHGAAAAQVGPGDALERLVDGVQTVASAVVAPAWLAAVAAVVLAWRRREPLACLLAGTAAAWSLLVVGMAFVLGYAALSRFLLPAVALVAALAGAGVVRLVATRPPGVRGRLLVAGAAVVATPFLVPRLAGIADVADEVARRGREQEAVPGAIAAAGGRETMLACGTVAVEGRSLIRPSFAWHLDVPLHRVPLTPVDESAVAAVLTGGREDRRLATRVLGGVELLARAGPWSVYAVRCPAAASAAR